MLVGGASILRGIKPKPGVAAIIRFLAGVSPTLHDFWRKEDPSQRTNHMINFTRNRALLGGAPPSREWKSLGRQRPGQQAKRPGTGAAGSSAGPWPHSAAFRACQKLQEKPDLTAGL